MTQETNGQHHSSFPHTQKLHYRVPWFRPGEAHRTLLAIRVAQGSGLGRTLCMRCTYFRDNLVIGVAGVRKLFPPLHLSNMIGITFPDWMHPTCCDGLVKHSNVLTVSRLYVLCPLRGFVKLSVSFFRRGRKLFSQQSLQTELLESVPKPTTANTQMKCSRNVDVRILTGLHCVRTTSRCGGDCWPCLGSQEAECRSRLASGVALAAYQ